MNQGFFNRLLHLINEKPKQGKRMIGLGAVEPKTGDLFFYKFSHLDTAFFEKFLELFSQAYQS